MMTLGRRFGRPVLNVGDNGAAPGLRGTLPFDDEGTPTRDTPLIKEGILVRSEEHTSELQSQSNLVCRLLLEKKKKNIMHNLYSNASLKRRSRVFFKLCTHSTRRPLTVSLRLCQYLAAISSHLQMLSITSLRS